MKQGDPLNRWKSSGPLGTMNGSCDVKHGGGSFGLNAFDFSAKTKNGNKQGLRLLFIFLIIIAIVIAVFIAFTPFQLPLL